MRVNANVLLRNPQTGAVEVINAGDEVPEWAKSKIGGHLEADEPKQAAPARKSRTKSVQGDVSADDDN